MNLPDPGFKPGSHVPQADSLQSKPLEKPKQRMKQILILQMAAIIHFFFFFLLQSFPGFLGNRSGIWNFLYSVSGANCLNYILCPRAAYYNSPRSSTGAIFQEPLRIPETVDGTDSTYVFPYTYMLMLEPNL